MKKERTGETEKRPEHKSTKAIKMTRRDSVIYPVFTAVKETYGDDKVVFSQR